MRVLKVTMFRISGNTLSGVYTGKRSSRYVPVSTALGSHIQGKPPDHII